VERIRQYRCCTLSMGTIVTDFTVYYCGSSCPVVNSHVAFTRVPAKPNFFACVPFRYSGIALVSSTGDALPLLRAVIIGALSSTLLRGVRLFRPLTEFMTNSSLNRTRKKNVIYLSSKELRNIVSLCQCETDNSCILIGEKGNVYANRIRTA